MREIQKQSAAKDLLLFSIPLVLSGVLHQLYNWADAFIVGHAEGDLALAAVGATAALVGFLLKLISGFTLGLSIFAAQQYGKQQYNTITRILSTFLLIFGSAYILLCSAGVIWAREILLLLDTPTDILPQALIYFRIVLIGMPFMMVYNIYAALLRAMGDSKVSLTATTISSAVNVLLDIILVVFLPFGVGGAAVATVISQIAMTIFVVIYSRSKYHLMRLPLKAKWLDRSVVLPGLALGTPPAVQFATLSFGNLILQNFMNGFGTATVLAITTAYRVDSILLLPVTNLSAAISTMTAQAAGAEDRYRMKQYALNGMVLMGSVSILSAVAMYLCGGWLIALFGVSQEALAIGQGFFRDVAAFYIFFGLASGIRGSLEGIGDMKYSSFIGIAFLVARILLSYLLENSMNVRAIAYAEGFAWIFMLVLSLLRVLQKRKCLGFCQSNNE